MKTKINHNNQYNQTGVDRDKQQAWNSDLELWDWV